MGDVADILGLGKPAGSNEEAAAVKALGLGLTAGGSGNGGGAAAGEGAGVATKGSVGSKTKPPAGMSREVFALLGTEGMPPIVPSKKPSVFKDKRSLNGSTKWEWAPFSNSARKDGVKLYHWVKSSMEYPDYPYARYNIAVDPVKYTQEEYDRFLQDPLWSKLETDHLVDLCHRYDLRWPVVFDRYSWTPGSRSVEQLQHRFYSVASRLMKGRAAAEGYNTYRGTAGLDVFDVEYEQQRRQQLELLFRKSSANQQEETNLRAELKQVEAQIKKLRQRKDVTKIGDEVTALQDARRGGGAGVGAGGVEAGGTGAVAPGGDGSGGGGGGSENRTPRPGQPYLQSNRLTKASQTPKEQLGKNLLKKANLMMAELGVPERMVGSKAVMDMSDELRRDTLTLFSLQKIAQKKENDLAMLQQKRDQILSGAAGSSLLGGGGATGLMGSQHGLGDGMGGGAMMAGMGAGDHLGGSGRHGSKGDRGKGDRRGGDGVGGSNKGKGKRKAAGGSGGGNKGKRARK